MCRWRAAFPSPNVARWLGFGLAAYSAIANDSIQTVGVVNPAFRAGLFE